MSDHEVFPLCPIWNVLKQHFRLIRLSTFVSLVTDRTSRVDNNSTITTTNSVGPQRLSYHKPSRSLNPKSGLRRRVTHHNLFSEFETRSLRTRLFVLIKMEGTSKEFPTILVYTISKNLGKYSVLYTMFSIPSA